MQVENPRQEASEKRSWCPLYRAVAKAQSPGRRFLEKPLILSGVILQVPQVSAQQCSKKCSKGRGMGCWSQPCASLQSAWHQASSRDQLWHFFVAGLPTRGLMQVVFRIPKLRLLWTYSTSENRMVLATLDS